jgi:hypothetical protein
MGYLEGVRYALGLGLVMATTGCPTSGTVPPSDASTTDDSSNVLVPELDGAAVQPVTSTGCTDPAHCISGVAALDPLFAPICISPQCTTWQVNLFDTYPVGNVQPTGQPVLVAQDGTWAFPGVGADGGASAGYYVQAAAVFAQEDGGQSVVTSVVGPLVASAANVAINVGPVQAVAYEARAAGGTMLLDWVLARLFDPSTGAPITSGADVSVGVEAGALPLAPTVMGASTVYYAAFPQPPGAMPEYTVTASHPAFGDAGIAVQLFADPPSFDGMITTADGGANGQLTIGWTLEPQADFELVEVYPPTGDGGWASTPAYASPSPDPPGQTSEVTSALDAGTYLVNVAYTRANCAVDAGCVQASTVAATTTVVR